MAFGLFGPQGLGGGLPGQFTGFGPQNNTLANQAVLQQMAQSDYLQMLNIRTQMFAEARRSQMQRWQINAELQTKIHEITAKVTVNKAKKADKAFQAMMSYIGS